MAIIGVVGGLLGKFYEDGLHRNFLHQVFGLICAFWQEPCLTNLLVIYLIGAEIIYTRKGTESR